MADVGLASVDVTVIAVSLCWLVVWAARLYGVVMWVRCIWGGGLGLIDGGMVWQSGDDSYMGLVV